MKASREPYVPTAADPAWEEWAKPLLTILAQRGPMSPRELKARSPLKQLFPHALAWLENNGKVWFDLERGVWMCTPASVKQARSKDCPRQAV